MLTIFTIPKEFCGNIEISQLNAVQSWAVLQPACEIVLCGDEPGVKEVAAEFKARHLPNIECNEYGTPLISSAFEKVTEIASFPRLCYVNADIILLDDFMGALQQIHFREYLMIGQRHNIDLGQRWDFSSPDRRQQLRQLAVDEGSVASHYFIDYFVFLPNGELEKLPPFAVGRPRWDSWFVYHARSLGIPVVDVSRVVVAIHQNHDYSHIPHKDCTTEEGSEFQWEGPEARRNRELSTSYFGSHHQFTLLDATHVLTPRSLALAMSLGHIRKRWHSLPVLFPRTKVLVLMINQVFRPIKWILTVLSKPITR